MIRIGTSFALAAAILSYTELALATSAPTTAAPTTAPPTKNPTKAPSTSPSSSPTAYEGTGEWYASTSGDGKYCKKDCATGGSDAECSGVNHDTASWLQDTYTSAAACCAAKYSYLDEDFCADRSLATPVGTNKYYSDLASGGCKKDDTPSLSTQFSSGTLFADAAACCTGALGWLSSDFCESRSAGHATGYHDKWYVDYQNMVCKKDCAVSGSNPECKPQTDGSSSNTLFASASDCCTGKLGWIDNTICTSVSTTGTAAAATGTDKYYADYSNSPARCAKDCDTANDPTCGGILSNVAGVQMFDTVASCCSAKFGWMDSDYCAALTTGSSTNKWYVDYQSNICKQDCSPASGACGGPPPDLSMQLYDDAATCCSTKLGWVQAATCTASSLSGAAASATGTLKYYADYTAGTCKIDCPVATASPQCGGVLTNTAGETLFDTASACCSAKFGWIDRDLCEAMGTGAYTNKFYVDYSSESCKQDCATGTNNCGGNPGDKSIQMFDTAAACCSSKLSYVNQASCTSKSTTGTAAAAVAATGSNKWYVDWSISKCAKDCATGSDAECGGLAETWEPASYDTWSACCDAKLNWVSDSDCHLG